MCIKNNNLEEHFNIMIGNLTSAKAAFQVYRALSISVEGKINYYTLQETTQNNSYKHFFTATISGMYKLVFIEIACFFENTSDKKPNAHSIRYFKKILEKNNQFPIIEKIENRLKKHKNLVKGIKEIRNKLIAHREVNVDRDSLYDIANITPNDILDLLSDLTILFREISIDMFGYENSLLFSSAIIEESTYHLLNALNLPNNL
ncbi:hypothetical protein H5A21_19825 [Pectobacterium aquaticum]|nr:hypothetical protein [Pectobacterium aquaticum]MBN3066262.1 hypothetical protein [Pectobacterium aquaticum]